MLRVIIFLDTKMTFRTNINRPSAKDKGISYIRWGNFRGNKKNEKNLSNIIQYIIEYFLVSPPLRHKFHWIPVKRKPFLYKKKTSR